MTIEREPRFLALDNIIRPGSDMIQKGRTIGLSELADCDVNHLLRIKALRSFDGDARHGSALLLRKDNPSPQEFIAEITRLQSALERLEDEKEAALSAGPPKISALPPDIHVMAERIKELEDENNGLRASLKNAAEQRDAARQRADQYSKLLTDAGKGPNDPTVSAAGNILQDDVGSPVPSVSLTGDEAEPKSPTPAISDRFRESQAAVETLASAIPQTTAPAGAPDGINAGTSPGIKSTTKKAK